MAQGVQPEHPTPPRWPEKAELERWLMNTVKAIGAFFLRFGALRTADQKGAADIDMGMGQI